MANPRKSPKKPASTESKRPPKTPRGRPRKGEARPVPPDSRIAHNSGETLPQGPLDNNNYLDRRETKFLKSNTTSQDRILGNEYKRRLGETWKDVTPKKLELFLKHLEVNGAPMLAARHARLSWPSVCFTKKDNPAFAAAWVEAEEAFVQALETEAKRRAYLGTKRGVYYRGRKVADEKVFSDVLLMFLLKARKPEKYREHFEAKFSGDIQVVVRDRFPVEGESKALNPGPHQVEVIAKGQAAFQLPAPEPTTTQGEAEA